MFARLNNDHLSENDDNIDTTDINIEIINDSTLKSNQASIIANNSSFHSLSESYDERKSNNQTFLCYICFDCVNISNDEVVVTLGCGHRFCKCCFREYLSSKIIEACIDISCFHPLSIEDHENNCKDLCNYQLTPDEIKAIIADNNDRLLFKYQRFIILKSDPNMRECCYCEHLQVGNPYIPRTVCESCSRVYCFHHLNAHPSNESCSVYEERIKNEQKLSLEYIKSNSKPCPNCGMNIGKIEGCNHMKCSQCKTAFCWLCGKQIDDEVFPSHFQWWNPSGCSNLQMNSSVQPSATTMLTAKILTCVQLIVFGPITVLSTIASFLLCSCCISVYISNKDDSNVSSSMKLRSLCTNCMSGWGMFWIGISICLPIVCAVFGLAAGIFLAAFAIIYPFVAISRIMNHQYPWPDAMTNYCSRRCCRNSVASRHENDDITHKDRSSTSRRDSVSLKQMIDELEDLSKKENTSPQIYFPQLQVDSEFNDNASRSICVEITNISINLTLEELQSTIDSFISLCNDMISL